MRIDAVQAYAFGPLAGETLRLTPGLNLIYGPNEAGKSSWHAALFAGLCGQPRGRGRGRREDQEFRERYRPWNGSSWQVGVLVTLADGRQVELRHDLEGRVACQATDALLGRDYSGEIMHDGAPDGSRWLGLDRRSFLAVACVQQTDVQGVLERPDVLKEYVQRVAASPHAEASVALALERLEQFRQEHVGRDIANAVRPLRRAKERHERAQEALHLARTEQAGYQELLRGLAELEAEAAAAEQALALLRARRSAVEAATWAARLVRVRELVAQRPGVPAPQAAGVAAGPESAAATPGREPSPHRPSTPGEIADMPGSDAAPVAPWGQELEPSPEVTAAAKALDAATERRTYHGSERPAPFPRQTGDLSPAELYQLAATLRKARPLSDPTVEQRSPAARRRAPASPVAWLVRPLVFLVATLALAGLAALAAGHRLPGLLLLVAAVALGLGLLLRRSGAWRRQPLAALQPADLALGRAQPSAEEDDRQQQLAQQRLQALGLPPDAAALERLAGEVSAAALGRQHVGRWEETQARLEAEERAARAWLAELLRRRGIPCGGDVTAAYQGYLVTCACHRERAQANQAELRALLGDRTPDDFASEVRRRAALARQLADGLAPEALAVLTLEPDAAAQEAHLASAAQAASGRRDRASGQVAERRRMLRPLAETEEELAAAKEAYDRVLQLDRTLELTQSFLAQAQRRVHQSVAPVLAAAVRQHLPALTGGRYRAARVDPETLAVQVQVADGHWRPAAALSHGTAEQVYLLLRVALATHLTRAGECCPLILDDVTVHCDADRKQATLAALHAISRERQVMLFSQEEDVLRWATAQCRPPRDQVVTLAALPA